MMQGSDRGEVEFVLITFHGTMVHFDTVIGCLRHVAIGACTANLFVTRTDRTATLSRQDGAQGCAEGDGAVTLSRIKALDWEGFLLVTPEDIARLGFILGNRWLCGFTGMLSGPNAYRCVEPFSIVFDGIKVPIADMITVGSDHDTLDYTLMKYKIVDLEVATLYQPLLYIDRDIVCDAPLAGFRHLLSWVRQSQAQAAETDQFLWRTIRNAGVPIGFLDRASVAYRTRHREYYLQAGEAAPAGTVSRTDLHGERYQ